MALGRPDRNLPATVVSSTLAGPLDSPNATIASSDGVEVVARLEEEPEARCTRAAACR